MKKFILLILLVHASSFAQIKGNKNIETRKFSAKNIEVIKVNLYADVTIDYAKKEEITITTDSNLFEFIDTEVEDNILDLNQLQWIASSQKIVITIGSPHLIRVESGTHDVIKIVNINTDYFNVMAPIGKVILTGEVMQLNLGIERATIDASNLLADNVRLNIWDSGKAIVYVTNELHSILDKNARVEVLGNPKIVKGDSKKLFKKKDLNLNKSANYIKFKIKNNSLNRNHFLVVGHKKDGSSFSYGFPMMPFAVRKETWTVGTKVYKVSSLGLRKLLVTIAENDEGETINLF